MSALKSRRNQLIAGGVLFVLALAFFTLKGTVEETVAASKPDLQKSLLEGDLPEVHSLGVILASPNYQLFSEISLKITEGNLSDSLKESISLQDKIVKEDESYLYVLNLYRIGVLQKKLGNFQDEKEVWESLEGMLYGEDTPAYLKKSSLSLVEGLTSEDTSLKEYLTDRKKALSQASSL